MSFLNSKFKIISLFIIVVLLNQFSSSFLSSKPSSQSSKIELKLIDNNDHHRIFVDEFGRERIFHGTNAVVKGEPWVPDTSKFSLDISLVEEDFKIMKNSGLNILRLGAMWPGIEPKRGEYNMTYIDELEKIVNKAGEYGIYTLLDMHQDVLSEAFCGEGIPSWAVKSDGFKKLFKNFPSPIHKPFTKLNDDGFPTKQDCNKFDWATFYLAEDTGKAYQALYSNVDGITDAWGEMWAVLAERFKDNKNILGYQLINEPFAGDIYKNPAILIPFLPFSADFLLLQKAYDKLNKYIREKNPTALIFFDGVTWDDLGVKFTHPPGGLEYSKYSVVSYHYYSLPQFNIKFQIETQLYKAKKMKTGIFLTESDFINENSDIADGTDNYFQSWAYWEMKSFFRETNETKASTRQAGFWGAEKTGFGANYVNNDEPYAIKYLTRPYAYAIAGKGKTLKYNKNTGDFYLEYISDASIKEPTIIYFPEKVYKNEYKLEVLASKDMVSYEVVNDDQARYIKIYNISNNSGKVIVNISLLLKNFN